MGIDLAWFHICHLYEQQNNRAARSVCRVYHCALWFTLDTPPGRTDFVRRGASLGKLLPGMILQQVQSGRRYQSASIHRPFRLPGALVERPGRIHSDGGILSRTQRARKSKRRFFSGDRNPGPKLFPATGTGGHGGCGPDRLSGSSALRFGLSRPRAGDSRHRFMWRISRAVERVFWRR